jgi:hypothetical protein
MTPGALETCLIPVFVILARKITRGLAGILACIIGIIGVISMSPSLTNIWIHLTVCFPSDVCDPLSCIWSSIRRIRTDTSVSDLYHLRHHLHYQRSIWNDQEIHL